MIKRFIVFIISLSIFNCTSSTKMVPLELVKEYGGASAVRLDEYSLKNEIIHLLNIFNEPIKIDDVNQLWTYFKFKNASKIYSSSTPNKDNLITFKRILNEKNLNTAKLSSATFESLFALSRLPVAIYIISIDFNKNIASNENINHLTDVPVELEEKLSLSIVNKAGRTESGITFSTSGDLKVSGSGKELLNGSITLLDNNKLIKTFEIYIISQLPLGEVEEYINDWYRNLSYEYGKPEIIDLKQE